MYLTRDSAKFISQTEAYLSNYQDPELSYLQSIDRFRITKDIVSYILSGLSGVGLLSGAMHRLPEITPNIDNLPE